ncbi:MAG: ADP-ribosylglycohydrolase family protein, partial [Pseudoflavonifractor sp.]
QIFIDTWGLIWPGNPAKAAEYARIAASVSHDGEGLHGAAFIAACIAAAFTCTTVDEVLDAGLGELPEDCEYRRVVTAVREFHAAHPGDFRACRDYVDRAWGYHKYPGYCHIIPNAGVCVLALLYGGGVLSRTIEIACMCAMDTDCNASNTGTIVGVLGGLGPIPPKYRDPIHDAVVLSCVSGYLNILDGAAFSEELACIAAALREEALPTRFVPAKQGELRFDLELPGATHGLELSTEATHRIRQTTDRAHTGTGSLALFIDGKQPEDATLSFKAFYCRRDFNDERYSPVFSPRVYPGQTVSVWMYSEQLAPAAVTVVPYLTRALDDAQISFPPTVLPREQWTQVTFTIPDLMGDQVHDVGWAFHAAPEEDIYVFGTVYLDDISVTGPMDYTVEFRLQRKEFGQVTPFSFNQCDGTVENGRLLLTSQGEGQAFTGHYYMTDGFVEADVIPSEGASCALLLRGQGCERYYTLGFEGENRVALVRHGYAQREVLACAPCRCLPGR